MEVNYTNRKNGLALLCILASLSTMIYFPIVEILGQFSITVNSNIYALYNYAVFGISIVVSTITLISIRKGRIHRSTAKGLGLVLLIVLLFFVYSLFYQENEGFFLYFLLWATPALLVGMLIPTINNSNIPKLLEPVALIMGIASITAASRYLSIGISHLNTLSFGGTNYQGLSYTAAFCVGLELYYIFLASGKDRFRLFNNIVGKMIEVLVGLGAAFAVFVSGGRGGLLLLVLNTLFFLVLLRSKNIYSERGNRIIQILLITLIILSILIMVRHFRGNSLISDSVDRLMSYINPTSGSIVWNLGRNNIYKDAIKAIVDNPVYGYGFFNNRVLGGEPYPHNVLLEAWINAGFLYMVLWLIILISLCRYVFLITKMNLDNGWTLYLLTYSIVFLSVSGTYLWCSELWFIIGIMLSGQILEPIPAQDEE